jgi:hypothetical protein
LGGISGIMSIWGSFIYHGSNNGWIYEKMMGLGFLRFHVENIIYPIDALERFNDRKLVQLVLFIYFHRGFFVVYCVSPWRLGTCWKKKYFFSFFLEHAISYIIKPES